MTRKKPTPQNTRNSSPFRADQFSGAYDLAAAMLEKKYEFCSEDPCKTAKAVLARNFLRRGEIDKYDCIEQPS